jgi:hypothetical protein
MSLKLMAGLCKYILNSRSAPAVQSTEKKTLVSRLQTGSFAKVQSLFAIGATCNA